MRILIQIIQFPKIRRSIETHQDIPLRPHPEMRKLNMMRLGILIIVIIHGPSSNSRPMQAFRGEPFLPSTSGNKNETPLHIRPALRSPPISSIVGAQSILRVMAETRLPGLDNSRIAHDKRRPQRLLIEIPSLVKPPMLPQKKKPWSEA